MFSVAFAFAALTLAAWSAPTLSLERRDGDCIVGPCNITNSIITNLPASVQPNITIPPNQVPVFYAIGEGTQNYTCANSSSNPVSAGALAKFYNANYISPNDFQDLVAVVYEQETQRGIEVTQDNTELNFLGYHYFESEANNTISPVFDFRQGAVPTDTGFMVGKVVGRASSPDQDPTQAVPWLNLVRNTAIDGSGDVANTALRIWTKGGQPPATCKGQPAAFEVIYSAVYAFFK